MQMFYQQLIKWLNETWDGSPMRETDPIVDIDTFYAEEETILTGILKIIIQENNNLNRDIRFIDIKILLHLLGKGAKINQANKQGQLPLEIAVQSNRVAIVETLLRLPETIYSKSWSSVLNLQISIDEINKIIQMVPEENPQMRKLLTGHTLMIAAARNESHKVEEILSNNRHIEDLVNTTNEGETALSVAARNGHLAIVRLLLNNGARTQKDVSDKYYIFRSTCLLIAIENNQPEIVRFLLDNKYFSVHESGVSQGGSALVTACKSGNLNMVKALITYYNADVNLDVSDRDYSPNYGSTPLTAAASHGHYEIVEYLLKHGANPDQVDDQGSGHSALSFAVLEEHEQVIEILINYHANIDIRNIRNYSTPLICATQIPNTAIAQMLIARGAGMNLSDNNNQTALIYAARKGHTDIAQMLIAHGADMNHSDNSNQTALIYALIYGHTAIAQILINSGADIHHSGNQNQTALIHALIYGHTGIAQILINSGADIHHSDSQNKTALIHALIHGHTGIAQILINREADIHHSDNQNQTALIITAAGGHTAIAQILISSGAVIHHSDSHNRTALIYAANSGHTAIVQILINRGADIHHSDNRNRTALIYAANKGHTAIAKMLIDNGSDLEKVDNNQKNALMYAVKQCNNDSHYPIIKMLLEKSASRKKDGKIISNYEMIDLLAQKANNTHGIIATLMYSNSHLFEDIIGSGVDIRRFTIPERLLLAVITTLQSPSNTIYRIALAAHHGFIVVVENPELVNKIKTIIENLVSNHFARESLEMTNIAVTIFKLIFNKNLDLNIEDNVDKRIAQLTFSTLIKLNLDVLISPLLRKTGLTINDAMPYEYGHHLLTPLMYCCILGSTKSLKAVAKIMDESSLEIRRTTSSGSSDYGICPAANRQAR